MAQRAGTLARQFTEANDEMIAAAAGASASHWRAQCPGEGWTVGVTAHHVAVGHEPVAGLIMGVATGQQLPPITMEALNEGNAAHAREFADCNQDETVALLRSAGAAAAEMVRNLSDEQLDRSAEVVGQRMTAQQLAENILISHVKGHLASIRAATGA